MSEDQTGTPIETILSTLLETVTRIEARMKETAPLRIILEEVRESLAAQGSRSDERLATIDERLATFGERFATIDKRLATIGERFETFDERFAVIESKLDRLEMAFNEFKTEVREGLASLETSVEAIDASLANYEESNMRRQRRFEKRLTTVEARLPPAS